jgi:hypothetical protein
VIKYWYQKNGNWIPSLIIIVLIHGVISLIKDDATSSLYRSGSTKEEPEFKGLTDGDWEKLNKIIGYNKENSDEFVLSIQDKNLIQFSVKVRMKHNASRLTHGDECLADLSCDELLCNLQMYPETKIFDLNLGSYKLSSPYGLLAKVNISGPLRENFCACAKIIRACDLSFIELRYIMASNKTQEMVTFCYLRSLNNHP